MDAMPVTFAQVLSGWQAQIAHARQQLEFAQQQVLALAQGGTAVGTGVNAHPDFAALFCQKLSQQTGLKFQTQLQLLFKFRLARLYCSFIRCH